MTISSRARTPPLRQQRQLTIGNSTCAVRMPSTSTETISIAAWPALKARFLRLNTPLPANTTAERLFSCAGLTMNSQHTNLTDERFEHLVLLKKNKMLWT